MTSVPVALSLALVVRGECVRRCDAVLSLQRLEVVTVFSIANAPTLLVLSRKRASNRFVLMNQEDLTKSDHLVCASWRITLHSNRLYWMFICIYFLPLTIR